MNEPRLLACLTSGYINIYNKLCAIGFDVLVDVLNTPIQSELPERPLVRTLFWQFDQIYTFIQSIGVCNAAFDSVRAKFNNC